VKIFNVSAPLPNPRFSPAGFATDQVKVLPIASGLGMGATYTGYRKTPEAEKRAGEYLMPTTENFASELYPLTRYFRIYVDQDPKKPMDPVAREFLRYGMSKEAQAYLDLASMLALKD
jgi:hypothetical protein